MQAMVALFSGWSEIENRTLLFDYPIFSKQSVRLLNYLEYVASMTQAKSVMLLLRVLVQILGFTVKMGISQCVGQKRVYPYVLDRKGYISMVGHQMLLSRSQI